MIEPSQSSDIRDTRHRPRPMSPTVAWLVVISASLLVDPARGLAAPYDPSAPATPALSATSAARPATPGPTLAREDTMHTQVSEVLVRAPRVTLDEILARVAEGEARREAAITDEQFTATFRLVTGAGTPRAALYTERVVRVYKKKPNRVRTVTLREYDREKKQKSNVNVTFGGGMDEEIVNFAFKPSARRDFRYHIVGRDIAGGHLIYRIAFEPRTLLMPGEPAGLVWVDTNDFVIVRQELSFERPPVPLFLQAVKRMVVERRRSGDTWVLSRVLMRMETTLPLPKVGRQFDLALQFDDYALNTGLADAFFRPEHTP